MNKKPFSDRLTPGQVKQVLDALELPWRKYPINDGWVNIPSDELPVNDFLSDLSVNIYHGGYVNQFEANRGGPYTQGDIVTLVSLFYWGTSYESKKAIQWIRNICDMHTGTTPPDVPDGFHFANKWLESDKDNYVRMPNAMLHSNFKAAEKIVWLDIYERVNKNDIYSFASIRNIEERTNVPRSTVQRAIKKLVKAGVLIEKKSRTGRKSLRYPIIGPVDEINRKLAATEKTSVPHLDIDSNNYSQQETTVQHMDTTVPYMDDTVPNMVHNYSHLTRTNLTRTKTASSQHNKYCCADPLKDSVLEESEKAESLMTLLASLRLDNVQSPPAGYLKAFIATFIDTHRLINGKLPLTGDRTYDAHYMIVMNKFGYPASWD